MSDLIEIRWHGRGGQGAKTASNLVGKTASKMGKDIQAFPEYGPERMGAPVQAFNRISDQEFSKHCQISNPDCVVVLDPTLLDVVDVTDGVPEDGVLVINSKEEAQKIKDKLDFSGEVWTIDAYEISQEEMGQPIPNTPMIGAFLKGGKILDKEEFMENIKSVLQKKFGDEEVAEMNLAAIKRAYEEVKNNES